MLRCLGDYPLHSVTRIYNGQKFNHRKSCWYVVFKAELSSESLSNANLSAIHVEENLSKVNLLDTKKNLSTVGWIIPPSLRNNGLHCVFV